MTRHPRARLPVLAVVLVSVLILVLLSVLAGPPGMAPVWQATRVRAATGQCPDTVVLHTPGEILCTHGDDAEFAAAVMATTRGTNRPTAWAANGLSSTLDVPGDRVTASVAEVSVPCHGDGTSGNRIRAYYVYAQGARNLLARYRKQLVGDLLQANDIVYQSARQTHGVRYLRLFTNRTCVPTVTAVAVPAAALATFGGEVEWLSAHGLNATNRKYVLYTDRAVYCGLATLAVDASPGPFNASNRGPSYARIDRGCWSGPVTAHELMHTLGAVQKGAPHYDGTGHCTDEHDLMCYDAGGRKPHIRCPAIVGNLRADCGGDDYFNTRPRPATFLATHWNTAFNSFLYGGGRPTPTAPAVPVDITATMVSLTTATVSWRPAPGSYVQQYLMDSSTGTQWRGTARSWRGRSAEGATYTVAGWNQAGTGGWSRPIRARLPRPTAPTSVTIHDGTVNWRADSSLTAKFTLYGVSDTGRTTWLADLDPKARSAAVPTGLLGLGRYPAYQLCAVNDSGRACTAPTRPT